MLVLCDCQLIYVLMLNLFRQKQREFIHFGRMIYFNPQANGSFAQLSKLVYASIFDVGMSVHLVTRPERIPQTSEPIFALFFFCR